MPTQDLVATLIGDADQENREIAFAARKALECAVKAMMIQQFDPRRIDGDPVKIAAYRRAFEHAFKVYVAARNLYYPQTTYTVDA